MYKHTKAEIENRKIHGANLQVAVMLESVIERARAALGCAASISYAMKAAETQHNFNKAYESTRMRTSLENAKEAIAEAEEILGEITPL